MGATKTKLAYSKESESEKNHWWKKGKTHTKKQKRLEVLNGISHEFEEITEEIKCKNYTKFKRLEIKIVHNKGGKPFQELNNKNSSVIAEMSPGASQVSLKTERMSKSESLKFNDKQEFRDNATKSFIFCTDRSEHTFEKQSIDERGDTSLVPVKSKFEYQSSKNVNHRKILDSCFKLSNSIKSDESPRDGIVALKHDKQICKSDTNKVGINSLLDERKSSISSDSSHTERKTIVTDTIPNLDINHESQSMEQLKPNTYSAVNNVSVKGLKTFKGADDTDEEESESNITDVKELSSSYPDSNFCSDSVPLLTQSTDECYSVSSYSSQRSRADSTTMAKEVAWYNSPSKTCTKSPVYDHKVINTNNVCTTDDKNSDTMTTNLKGFESSCCSNGPLMNITNGKMDPCKTHKSEVRNGKCKEMVERHTQNDISNIALKECDKGDDVLAAMIINCIAAIICTAVLTKSETGKEMKSLDIEVDSYSKNKPAAYKGMSGKDQTSRSGEYHANLERDKINMNGSENDVPEANYVDEDFPSFTVFIVTSCLLSCKRRDKMNPEQDLIQDVSVEHKAKTEADITVIYQRIKSPHETAASIIHSMVKSSDNGYFMSETTSDTTDPPDRCIVESAAKRNKDDCSDANAEYAKSELSLSNCPNTTELQLKETEVSTETYHAESVAVAHVNDRAFQDNFTANSNHSDCFDITIEQDSDGAMVASGKCSDIKSYKHDKADKFDNGMCIAKNLLAGVKFRIENDKSCFEKDSKVQYQCNNTLKSYEHEHSNAVEQDESKLKLSESVRRENGAVHRPMVSTLEEHIECITPCSDGNTTAMVYHNECCDRNSVELSESVRKENGAVHRPMVSTLEEHTECIIPCSDGNITSMVYYNECCDRNSVELNENNSKLDLNEHSHNENQSKSEDGHCDAHVYPASVVKVGNDLILKDADLMKTNKKNELFSDNNAGNKSKSSVFELKKCSTSMNGGSRENIRIGSTKRDSEGKQIPKERKLEAIVMADLECHLSEENVYSSYCMAENNNVQLRKNKHRVKRRKKLVKKKEGSVNERKNGFTSVERDCKMNALNQKSLTATNFCQKCHHSKSRQNKTCSECRILDGELGDEKFQCQVRSKDDSGISTLLLSIRSSILSEMESIQSIETTKLPGHKKTRKVIKKYFKLGTLSNELQNITKRINDDALLNTNHDIVALPGLQSYFDSLRNGGTPSFQEQMRYEWLRLRSFSNYTGGGSLVHLARSGFYHSQNNETRCFCCNASYSNWVYSDDVQEVHRRISPNCPLVHGGIESNENISIESGTRDNHLQAPANLGSSSGTGVQQATSQTGYSTEKPAAATNHGGFAGTAAQRPNASFLSTTTSGTSTPTFSFHPPEPRPDTSGFRFPQTSNQLPAGTPNQVGQSAATVTTTRAPGFSFGSALNAPAPAGFTFGQSTSQQGGGSDISSQLRALTLQQSIGAQQPSDEPISGNPVIAPTQPLQIARQTGEGQLSISAQQPPETSDLPQNAARNQRTSESSGSASPAQQNESADTIEIAQLKHPRYRTMDVRMSSFRSWPNYLNQTPRQMAYAGFFHPGVADFARCFCCGGGLRNWEADDDPMVEHARWYPRCEYINKLKGTHFVQAVLRRHREHMAERQRELEVPQNTFLTPDPMTTSIAANLLDMGFTQERAREAILAVRQLRGRSEVSIEEVTTWMLDDGNTRHQEPAERGTTVNPRDTVATAPPQPARPRTPASSGSGSFESARQDSDGHSSVEDRGRGSAEEPQGATGGAKKEAKPPKAKSGKDESSSDDKSGKEDNSDDEKIRKDKDKSSKEDYSSDDKSKEDKDPDKKKPKSKKDKKKKPRKRQSGASGGASVDVDTKSLKEENKQLKQMQVCKICMDTYVCITFLPCGHLVCCEDCAKNMRKCPICRKRIKGQVRTFMS